MKMVGELIAWGRVLLEKVIMAQLVRKIPALYGNKMFITAFTIAHHISCLERNEFSLRPLSTPKIFFNIILPSAPSSSK
jgi:hypothetical protein